ncbi:hypothetical protein JRQ81_008909 [Phrynocephalus forsythii]|uniref:Uncharacterized protein n=1 Tax=Phrynocephalus forsythii TaxID=171643 RepID=A0A9Q0XCT5_9SAUR|nr:hypothetical protein JRQ81_008909 [Phrynocephalus forsythii]
MSASQPDSDPEGCSPAAAATLQPPTRLAWNRRRKTKSAKVESLLLQMLHQDAEEGRETRESVERGWARLEAWAQAEQEIRAREDEREQRHRQEVLNCMRETNGLIRRLVGDTNQLLQRILEAAPRTEVAGEAGSAADGASGAGDPAGRPRTGHAEGRLG